MDIVVSGIRSTGRLHLGNYFGAVRQFLGMQRTHQCYFFIADYHSLTTHPDPAALRASTRQVLIEYMACGIDPGKAVIYRQSDIPEIPELYMLLNMHAYVGELERVASFKEKVRKQPGNVNAGLLTYPVLMTADIIIHRARWVPVGKDQEQHLEMARNFVQRFNRLYGTDFFPEPYPFRQSDGQMVKVPGLDGSGKMGKSDGEAQAIFLSDDPTLVRKKVMRAVTDSGPTTENAPIADTISHLFQLLELVSPPDVVQHYLDTYAQCSIRYGDLKKQLAEDIIAFLTPIQEQIKVLEADEAQLKRVLNEGAEKARQSAGYTLRTVRELMGFNT
ncbi:MAG: tryptophan--tRNA ligase [Sphingomonadales bacterium]|nr:tryptophan--tRNA ligase [Sphingomonadales bacterium]